MRIPVEYLYIFIGVAATFAIFTASMIVANYLADSKQRRRFKRFNNAPIVINPYYVVSVDLVSANDNSVVVQLRFHLTKDSEKPSFDHPFKNGQLARQTFNEIARYLETI